MAPRRADRDLSQVEIRTYDKEGPEAEIADGVFIFVSRYTAEIRDPETPYRLVARVEVVGGEPQCRALSIEADEGAPSITGVLLRAIPLASYLERTLEDEIAFRPTHRGEDFTIGDALSPSDLRGERGRRRPKSEVLPRVVEEYRRALADPDPDVRRAPTQAVADRLHYQRGHVSRLLSEARKMDPPLLGPARKGRGGESPGRG